MRTDDPGACRYCGAPLPERAPGQRGRPRVVHPGTCHRLYRNRQKLAARCEAMRRAFRFDRSDFVPRFGYGVDPEEIEEGFGVIAGGFLDHVAIPAPVLEAWEAGERRRRVIEAHERQEAFLDEQARRAAIRPEVESAVAAVYALPDEERLARLREIVARRMARVEFRTQSPS